MLAQQLDRMIASKGYALLAALFETVADVPETNIDRPTFVRVLSREAKSLSDSLVGIRLFTDSVSEHAYRQDVNALCTIADHLSGSSPADTPWADASADRLRGLAAEYRGKARYWREQSGLSPSEG